MRPVKFRYMVVRVVVILALAAASSRAGVIYDFIGTGEPFGPILTPEPVAFQLVVADFINTPSDGTIVPYTCAELVTNTNCSVPGGFFQDAFGSVSGATAAISFDATDAASYGFFFPAGAFDAVGVYTAETSGNPGTPFNPGTLTVTLTPEPGTLLLVISEFCLLGALSRLWRKA